MFRLQVEGSIVSDFLSTFSLSESGCTYTLPAPEGVFSFAEAKDLLLHFSKGRVGEEWLRVWCLFYPFRGNRCKAWHWRGVGAYSNRL